MKAKDLNKFLMYWVVNTLLLFTAVYLMPNAYALGNMNYQPVVAAVVAGLALTFVGFSAKVFAKGAGISKRGRYPMFLYYWVANAAGIWLIARVADVTGFGIARYYWAILLGFLASALHWSLRQGLKRVKLVEK